MITLQERVHAAPKPDDWQLDKLHQVFRVRRGNKNTGMKEDNLLSLSYGRIIQKDIETADGLLPENFEGYQLVEPGNIVLRLPDLQNDKRSLRQGLVTQRGIITSAYDAVEVQRDNDPRFWFYSLLALDLAKHYYSMGGGVRQSVKFADFPNDWVYRPDLATQRQNADFLDRETARIDLLIEKKQRLVALLGEKRKSAIRHLVTGFDKSEYPNRKQSTSPWFRDLPTHWNDAPVKRFAKIESGHTPSRSVPEYWDNASIKWVSLADSKQLRKTDFISETTYQISSLGLAGSSARILPAGTVIFTRDATVGLAAITTSDMAVSQHLVGWICGPELLNEYLLYVFYAMEDELNRLTWGATIKTIGMPDLRALRTCLPPLREQREIVRRIRAVSKQVIETTKRLETSIDRLKEYRSALITAAVTGQIDVQTYANSGIPDRRLDAIQEEMGA